MAEQTSARVCPRCGNAIPSGSADCPRCADRLAVFLHSRETVLTGSVLIVVILFVVTGAVVRAYHQKLHALAREWFTASQQELTRGNPAAALSDLRNALVYEPEDSRIQFRLTQALTAAGRDEEARSYLEGLLARSPSDAEVNLALARIAVRAGNETAAMRYYHGAIYGVWTKDPQANRLNTRLELCQSLVGRNDDSNADGELIALQSDVPPRNEAALHQQIGELFLRAGDAGRALAEFGVALRGSRAPQAAWKGAGMAAYKLGYFAEAERYLERALRTDEDDLEMKAQLETSRMVQAWDPYLGGLTQAQRRGRVQHDFAQALVRLRTCAKSAGMELSSQAVRPAATELGGLYAQALDLLPRLTDRNLSRHPEETYAAMNLALQIETATAQKCGEPSGLDKALLELRKFEAGGQQ